MENSKRVALITGITGQDGIYMAKYLLEKGNYEVHGIVRRTSMFLVVVENIRKNNSDKMFLHPGDLTDYGFVTNLIKNIQPDEIYNFAAQTQVQFSLHNPILTADITGLACVRLLEAIKQNGLTKKTKFLQASSSEMLTGINSKINEDSPVCILNPYAAAKLYAHHSTGMYRKLYEMYACCFIAFNHESLLRGFDFVTRKITLAAARIAHGLQDCLSLGNMDSRKDWGFTGDYVEAFWKILNESKEATDYVVGTGNSHTVREFATLAFKHAGIDLEWEGKGVDEVGKESKTGRVLVKVDPQFFRPGIVKCDVADITKIKSELGWEPKTSFEDLVKDMVQSDMVYVVKQADLDRCLFH